MTEIFTLGTFVVVHLVALASPGPNLLIVSQTAVSRSRRAGMWVTAGISTGAATFSTLALLSLDFLFGQIPWAYGALKLAGGGYLFYLGFRLWRSADTTIVPSQPDNSTHSNWRADRLGLFTALTNPKAALFFGSVMTALFPPASPTWVKIAVIGLVIMDSFGFHAAIACLFSLPGVQERYQQMRRWTDRLAGGALMILGIRLVR